MPRPSDAAIGPKGLRPTRWLVALFVVACLGATLAAHAVHPSPPLLVAGLALSALVGVAAVLVGLVQQRAATIAREATERIATSEEWYRAIVQDASDIVLVYDLNGIITFASPATFKVGGYVPATLLGRPINDLLHPDDHERAAQWFIDVLSAPGGHGTDEYRVRHAGGHYLDVEASVTNLVENDAVAGFVANLRDITERKRAETDLARAQELFRSAFEEAPIGMAIADMESRILRANRSYGRILGRSPEELVGMTVQDLTHPDDWDLNRHEMDRLFAGEIESFKMEKRYIHAEGHLVWASVSVSIVRDDDGRPVSMIGQVEDVTERRAISERLAHAAIHDPMTGLPNRILFLDRLGLALARAARKGSRVGVVFLDLDRFKVVNDSLGHASGDRLLVAVADRLRNRMRPTDTVARFGGDEFVVLCDDITGEAAARDVAQRLMDALSRPITLPEGEVFVTGSIGIAVSGDDATPETLLRDADAAMYRAKDNGRARIEVFEAHTHDKVLDSLRTGNALHRALERGEFEVHYQPVVDLDTGTVSGFEALIRWQHPERGLVPPGEFVPLAEETGLIVPIGLWVLEEACRQTARWQREREAGRPPLTISVNLAPRQLSEPNLPAHVAEIIARTGIDPTCVWLEITESALMHDAERAIVALRSLRALGVHISVDDFGTGYSSLSYLKRFPVEALKVDRSFVDGLGREPEDSAIVSAVVSLAHALGLVAVAEGLETEVQLGELRRLGCDKAQGFLFGRPRPAQLAGDHPADDLLAWSTGSPDPAA